MERKEDTEKKGFMYHNNYSLVELKEEEYSIVKVELKEQALNPFGIAHGGLIFGLGDTAMGIVVNTKEKIAVTLSSNITYLRPAKGSYLIAKAKMVKKGKTISYLNAEIYNEKDVLVATMDADYCYVD